MFVHKAAGAAARAGGSLDDVAAAAERVAANLGTLGVALTVCTVPGGKRSDRLDGDTIEVGLGPSRFCRTLFQIERAALHSYGPGAHSC